MNLTTVNNIVTMSSREIADLTGKEHKNVLADVRKMLEELKIDSAEFSAQYRDITGRSLPEFNLPKRETLILVSGYSIELRSRIIDRWQELENGQQFKIPQTYGEALQLAADQAKRIEHQDKIIEEAQPAIGFYDAVGDSTSLTSVGDAAKSLGFGRNHFFKWLRNKEFLMKDYNTPYQKWIEARYFQVKYQSYVDEFGEVKHRPVTFITGKGLQYLQKQLD